MATVGREEWNATRRMNIADEGKANGSGRPGHEAGPAEERAVDGGRTRTAAAAETTASIIQDDSSPRHQTVVLHEAARVEDCGS